MLENVLTLSRKQLTQDEESDNETLLHKLATNNSTNLTNVPLGHGFAVGLYGGRVHLIDNSMYRTFSISGDTLTLDSTRDTVSESLKLNLNATQVQVGKYLIAGFHRGDGNVALPHTLVIDLETKIIHKLPARPYYFRASGALFYHNGYIYNAFCGANYGIIRMRFTSPTDYGPWEELGHSNITSFEPMAFRMVQGAAVVVDGVAYITATGAFGAYDGYTSMDGTINYPRVLAYHISEHRFSLVNTRLVVTKTSGAPLVYDGEYYYFLYLYGGALMRSTRTGNIVETISSHLTNGNNSHALIHIVGSFAVVARYSIGVHITRIA